MWALLLLLVICPLWTTASWPVYLLGGSCVYLTYAYSPALVATSAPFNTFLPAKIAYYSCSQLLTRVNFCGDDKGVSCYCGNSNAFATMAYCFHAGHAEQIPGFLGLCNAEADMSLGMDDFSRALEHYYDNATGLIEDMSEAENKDFSRSALQSGGFRGNFSQIRLSGIDSSRINHTNIQSSSSPSQRLYVGYPVRLSDGMISLFRDSYDQFLGNYNRSIAYGWYLVLFWGVVFAIAAVGNWAKVWAPSVFQTFTGRHFRVWRSQVTLPALAGRRKTNEVPFLGILDFLAPTRAECLILAAFSVLTVALCFRDIRFVPGGPFFKNKTQAFMRYYAVRSGTLASYLLPLSVLFAGRNNLLQNLTRWDYSVFIMFHRWISRWMILLLVVHSIGYSHHIYKVKAIEDYVWCGILGTAAGLAIIVQGLLVLRRRWYEAFLALHIVLAAVFMVGAWFHVKDLRFLAFYYFSVCLWVADRLFRLQRLCNFGFPMAQVQLYEDDTLKVCVPIPPGFHAEAGGHCFVHFLQWWCFWQSHPFTYTVFNQHIIFYVKAKDGVTRRLRSYLRSNLGNAALIRVAVEGSYGEATAAHRYDTSVFVAGGSGIPGIYAEAAEVAKRNNSDADLQDVGPYPTRRLQELGGPQRRTSRDLENTLPRVKLLWTVRECHSALWFVDELSLLAGLPIEVSIFLTKPSQPADCSDKTHLLGNILTPKNYPGMENLEKVLHKQLPHVTFYTGRPNLRKIVATEVNDSAGSTCFVACGHPLMVDELRAEVVAVVAKSEKRVDFFEQLQVWA